MIDENNMDIPPDASVVMLDHDLGTLVMNQSDLETSEIFEHGREVGSNRSLLAALSSWATTVQSRGRSGGILERDKYVSPSAIFDQMQLALYAVENDDVVSNIADATEATAFNSVSFYADDEDEEDVYNQIAKDINLDGCLREMWRELFTVSQFTCGIWWHTKTFKVRGKGKAGRKKRKEYTVRCPKALTLIDSMKVIPVGSTMFGQERLVYAADRSEHESFLSDSSDEIKNRLLLGRYQPTRSEAQMISALSTGDIIDSNRLWILNPSNVFRHTLTRGQQRFAPIRMQSVFEILDMKNQLRAKDRAHLLGAANFIVLITKGSDALPAKPEEVARLAESVRTVARVPIMVGDHRLDVKIVTPPMDNTLKSENYDLLDGRITARLYNMFVLGQNGSGASGDDSMKLSKMIARGMESRRHMIVRSLEKNIFDEIFEKNDNLETSPKLRFHPNSIDLTFDAGRAAMVMDLRDRGEISRDTALSQFDFSQEDEARFLEREEESGLNKIFKTINPNNQGVPSAGGPANPAPNTNGDPQGGRKAANGGRKAGGAAPGSGQGQAPRNPSKLSSEQELSDGEQE